MHLLKETLDSIPSLVKNTKHLVKKLESVTVPASATLVTIDVKALYPSIPQAESIARTLRRLEKVDQDTNWAILKQILQQATTYF